ncbi:MAG: hypothetical protein CMF07_00025 [Idiomarina sp.]|nr:hypothetical protein [Idiomarina sp.]
MMLVIEGAADGCSGLLRRCAEPWMALPKPYMDVFTGASSIVPATSAPATSTSPDVKHQAS